MNATPEIPIALIQDVVMLGMKHSPEDITNLMNMLQTNPEDFAKLLEEHRDVLKDVVAAVLTGRGAPEDD